MAASQFCLRWNNHQPNFVSVFSSLLQDDQLVDVTLIAENNQIQAHKVVLSACSDYFKTLFLRNPCTHPIIILTDVKYVYLTNLIEFMYRGEANIHQEHLPELLRIAELLKVKGLEEIPSFDFSNDFEHLSARSEQLTAEIDTEIVEALSDFEMRTDGGNEDETAGAEDETEANVMQNTENDLKFENVEKFELENKEMDFGENEDLEEIRDQMLTIAQKSPEAGTDIESNKNCDSGKISETLRSFRRNRSTNSDPVAKPVSNVISVTALTSTSQLLNSAGTTISRVELTEPKPNGIAEITVRTSNPEPTNSSHNGNATISNGCDKSSGAVDSTGTDHEPYKKRQIKNVGNLQRALEAVRFDGIGFCKAARIHGVNNRTLWLQYHKLGYPSTTARSRKRQFHPIASPK